MTRKDDKGVDLLVLTQKMVEQTTSTLPPRIALVTDSTAELSLEARQKYRTIVVPLHVSLGNTSYLDGVDLDAAGFYERFREAGQSARSSQPSVGEFIKLYAALLGEHDHVISIHIAGSLSGTVQSAHVAAESTDPDRVRVVDSRQVSVGLGLVVRAAGQAIATGKTVDEVLAATEAAILDTRLYGAVPSLEVAVRGGRVRPSVARLARLIDLKPIIAFDEQGAAHTDGGRLGFSWTLRALVDRVARFASSTPAYVAIAHADNEAAAEYMRRRLRGRLGEVDIPIFAAGAVITAHVGLGAVAVAVQRVPSPPGVDRERAEVLGGA
jgi:uncharacterized protein